MLRFPLDTFYSSSAQPRAGPEEAGLSVQGDPRRLEPEDTLGWPSVGGGTEEAPVWVLKAPKGALESQHWEPGPAGLPLSF